MRKRLFTIILTVLLTLTMVLPVSAEAGTEEVVQETTTQAEVATEEKFSVKSEPAQKRSGKFAHLKFGDNYDVSAE